MCSLSFNTLECILCNNLINHEFHKQGDALISQTFKIQDQEPVCFLNSVSAGLPTTAEVFDNRGVSANDMKVFYKCVVSWLWRERLMQNESKQELSPHILFCEHSFWSFVTPCGIWDMVGHAGSIAHDSSCGLCVCLLQRGASVFPPSHCGCCSCI